MHQPFLQPCTYHAYLGAISYRAFFIKHRDSKYLTAALKEARPMVEIDHSELDKNPFLPNTPDYTIDLRKGLDSILPHKPEDFITKCTTLSPNASGADIWEEALNVFFCGDEELNAEIIREFVEKIYMYKAERIDGKRIQRIKIEWNCIGEFTLSERSKHEKTA